MKCAVCESKKLPEQKEAAFLPVMLLFAPPKRFPGAPPARSVCGIPVCEEHRPDISLDYLLSDEGYASICQLFAARRKVAPERSATRLEFVDINSFEARSFLGTIEVRRAGDH
jgi:hypothetical protein